MEFTKQNKIFIKVTHQINLVYFISVAQFPPTPRYVMILSLFFDIEYYWRNYRPIDWKVTVNEIKNIIYSIILILLLKLIYFIEIDSRWIAFKHVFIRMLIFINCGLCSICIYLLSEDYPIMIFGSIYFHSHCKSTHVNDTLC